MKRSSFRTQIDDGQLSIVTVSGHLQDALLLTVRRREGIVPTAVGALLSDDQVKDLIDSLEKYLACEVA